MHKYCKNVQTLAEYLYLSGMLLGQESSCISVQTQPVEVADRHPPKLKKRCRVWYHAGYMLSVGSQGSERCAKHHVPRAEVICLEQRDAPLPGSLSTRVVQLFSV